MDSHQRRSEDLGEGGGRETILGTYSMKVIYFCERKIDKCEREIRKACFLLPTFLLSAWVSVSIAVFTLPRIWGFGLAA